MLVSWKHLENTKTDVFVRDKMGFLSVIQPLVKTKRHVLDPETFLSWFSTA